MPRRISKVEACMICGTVPCACNGAPKPAKRKSAGLPRQVTSIADLQPNSSAIQDAMKRQAEDAKLLKEIAQQKDPDMERAIRVLAPILHPSEKRRFAAILAVPTDLVRDRASAWKARRSG